MAGLLKSLPPRSTRESDAKIVSKSKQSKQVATTVKGGGKSVIDLINTAVSLVQMKLGKYADDYIVIRDEKQLDDYFKAMVEQGIAAIDMETSSLNVLHCAVAGVCLYARGLPPAYVPIGHMSYITNVLTPNQLSQDIVSAILEKYHRDIKWVMHNAVFDVSVIKYIMGVDITCYWDTWVAAKLLNEYESAQLKELHLKYCYSTDDQAFTYSVLFDDLNFCLVPISTAYLYAAGDGIKTLDLYEFQLQYLNRRRLPTVYRVFTEVEMPLIPIIAEMQMTGISFDKEYCQELSVEYHAYLKEAEDCFYQSLNRYQTAIDNYKRQNPNHKLSDPILISSPLQLAILLYDIIGLKSPDHDKPRGTGDEILEKMDTDVTHAIQNYRTIEKLLSTYIDKLPISVDPKTNRIHCNLNSLGARTGRFSSSDPNLQNIPSKDKKIRKVFIATKSYSIISVDLSQQEPRTLADRSGDESLIQAYRDGKDIYAWIASIVYQVPYEECKEHRPDGSKNVEGAKKRANMKSVILGIMYSRGAKAIGEQLGISTKEAQKIIDLFYDTFPNVKQYVEDTLRFATENGYVLTAWGRKCRIPDMQLPPYEFSYHEQRQQEMFDPLAFDAPSQEGLEVDPDMVVYYTTRLMNTFKAKDKAAIMQQAYNNGIKIRDNTGFIAEAKRQCVNSVIQGSAADMVKRAMILIYYDDELRELGYRMLVPVHDEILGEAPTENAKRAGERVSELMILAASECISVPMKCDIEITDRWYGESLGEED